MNKQMVKSFATFLIFWNIVLGSSIPTLRNTTVRKEYFKVSENIHDKESSNEALLIVGGGNNDGYLSSVDSGSSIRTRMFASKFAPQWSVFSFPTPIYCVWWIS